MNWTERDLQKHLSTRTKKVLGDTRELQFSLRGSIPSFKNSKQLFVHNGKPGMTTKPEYAAVMADLVGQIQTMRLTAHPLTKVEYFFRFLVCDLRASDGDGCEATLLDCLREAGLIVNDNRRHITRCLGHDFEIVPKGSEGVSVRIVGQEYISKSTTNSSCQMP